MRLRLLEYCCRIWERDLRQRPKARNLRPIVPVVFYQGARRWRHAPEFSELFAETVREWPWVPQFEHVLVDQSEAKPGAVRGELRGQVAQLMMMAYRHHVREALERAGRLLGELPGGGGMEVLRALVVYVMATQDEEGARMFGEALRREVRGMGGEVMRTYAEQLLDEGIQKGQIETIEGLLRVGMEWSTIEAATGIGAEAFRALEQRLEEGDSATWNPEA